jgi:hydrogenase maturation factor
MHLGDRPFLPHHTSAVILLSIADPRIENHTIVHPGYAIEKLDQPEADECTVLRKELASAWAADRA